MQSAPVIFLAAGVAALACAVATMLLAQRRAARRLLRKLECAVDDHIDRLVRVRAEWVRFDEDGRLHSPQWEREIGRFLDGELPAVLDARDLRRLEADRARFVRLIADRVAAGAARHPYYR
ncbi:MAG TPA: hypothetical protein VE397_12360 [Stellaceae bacterium]|jgi:hypothetical protein|nr:hypothetical protein [Stellaceae bacterium]